MFIGAVYRSIGLDKVLPDYHYRASHQTLFHSVMARIAKYIHMGIKDIPRDEALSHNR